MLACDVYKSGVWYSVSDDTYCGLMAYDNLGMAPDHDISDRGPMQHGESYISHRLDPRTFNLVLGIAGTSASDLESKRLAVLNLFKPRDGLITVRFTTDAGEYRCIQCHYAGGMELGRKADDPWFIKAGVSLKAHDPTFYDPTSETTNFQLGGGAAAFEVPLAVPVAVGASTIDQDTTITNTGSWLSYPTIRITGPITDCIITNTSTDEELDFTDTTIATGHYYDIDCRYGYKTVLLDGTTNKIADLSADSDLATFHLAADPEVIGGGNNINVTGSAIDSNTKISITYSKRYIGI